MQGGAKVKHIFSFNQRPINHDNVVFTFGAIDKSFDDILNHLIVPFLTPF